MTVEQQNFEIYAGDTKNVSIVVEDEDNDLPVLDITGCTATWILYDPYNSDEILITKILGSGITIPTPSNGTIIVSLLPEDTISIEPANWYVHETEIVDAFGNVTTTTIGFLRIKKSKA